MRIANHANLSAAEHAQVERELPDQRTLMDVLQWGRESASGVRLPQVVSAVIAQDEYAHDVIVPWREPLVLVYGAT